MVSKYGLQVPLDNQMIENCPCISSLLRANFYTNEETRDCEIFMKNWILSIFDMAMDPTRDNQKNEKNPTRAQLEYQVTKDSFEKFRSSVRGDKLEANREWTNIPTMLSIVAFLMVHSALNKDDDLIGIYHPHEAVVTPKAKETYSDNKLYFNNGGLIKREFIRKGLQQQKDQIRLIRRATAQVKLLCEDSIPRFRVPADQRPRQETPDHFELEDLVMLFVPSSNRCPCKLELLKKMESVIKAKFSFQRHLFGPLSSTTQLKEISQESLGDYYNNVPNSNMEKCLAKLLAQRKEEEEKAKKEKQKEKQSSKGKRKGRGKKTDEDEEDEEDEDEGNEESEEVEYTQKGLENFKRPQMIRLILTLQAQKKKAGEIVKRVRAERDTLREVNDQVEEDYNAELDKAANDYLSLKDKIAALEETIASHPPGESSVMDAKQKEIYKQLTTKIQQLESLQKDTVKEKKELKKRLALSNSAL